MILFIIRRLLQTIAFIFLAIGFVYTVVVVLLPTGPRANYEQAVTEYANWQETIIDNPEYADFPEYTTLKNAVEGLAKDYKVDQPWPLNYLLWLFDPNDTTDTNRDFEVSTKGIDVQIGSLHIKGSGILTGDFGKSKVIQKGTPVSEFLSTRIGYSAILIVLSLFFAFLVGIPIGVVGAIRNHSTEAHALTFATLSLRSIPPFALGLVLVLVVGVIPYQLHVTSGWTWMPYLPISGIYDEGQEGNWINRIYHLALPVFTLTALQIPTIARYVRATFLEVLGQDYIRTARAKGLSRRSVLYKHTLRNAMIPLITLLGLAIPGIFSTAIIIEQVFSYPGIGMLYYTALGGSFLTGSTFQLLDFNSIPSPVGGPLDGTLVLAI
ncbi:MAG: ABC transporter permease, partial [Chloroflexia bacterium]